MIEGGGVEQGSLGVWVKIAKCRAELLPGLKDLGSGVEFSISDRVVDDLNSLEIGLKLDEILHHGFGSGVKLLLAEVMEVLQP